MTGAERPGQGRPPRRVDRPALVIAVLAPVAVAAVAVAISLGLRGDLPDPVARHWGTGGADGFSSLDELVAVMSLLIVGIGLLLCVPAALTKFPLSMRRLLLGVGVGTAVFIAIVHLASLLAQRGMTDAREASFSAGTLLLGILAGLGAGALAARVPRAQGTPVLATRPPKKSLPRLAEGAPRVVDERIGLAARLRVDETGLVVRWFGARALTVPLAEVAGATVTAATPMQFGGWGLRLSVDGRIGFITRRGDAVDVVKADGQHVLVTSSMALRAAGILNTVATETRRAPGKPPGSSGSRRKPRR